MKSDKEGGYRTIPVIYGLEKAAYLAIVLSVIWFLLTITLIIRSFSVSLLSIILISIDGVLLLIIASHLRKLISKYTRLNALTIHKYFVLERITLASAVISLIVDIHISLLIYAVSLGLTAMFQMVLRNQYEFNKWEL